MPAQTIITAKNGSGLALQFDKARFRHGRIDQAGNFTADTPWQRCTLTDLQDWVNTTSR